MWQHFRRVPFSLSETYLISVRRAFIAFYLRVSIGVVTAALMLVVNIVVCTLFGSGTRFCTVEATEGETKAHFNHLQKLLKITCIADPRSIHTRQVARPNAYHIRSDFVDRFPPLFTVSKWANYELQYLTEFNHIPCSSIQDIADQWFDRLDPCTCREPTRDNRYNPYWCSADSCGIFCRSEWKITLCQAKGLAKLA